MRAQAALVHDVAEQNKNSNNTEKSIALQAKILPASPLTASSTGAAFWHVGRLVPVQHIARRIQITDLAQSLLEFDQHLLGRATIARRLACGSPRAGCGLGFVLHGAIGTSAPPPP